MPNQPFDLDELDQSGHGGAAGPSPGDHLRFVLGAARRHWLLTLGVFLAGFAVLGAYYATKTPLYRVETHILAQRQLSMPSIIRSNMAEDQPTRAAVELIHQRDNLLDLIRKAGLLEAPPKVEALDRLRGAGSSEPARPSTDKEFLDTLLVLLDRRLKVEVTEVTINIELDWPDPQQAYQLVDGALQNFLEARHLQEVQALDEPIATLKGRASVLREELASAVETTRRGLTQGSARAAPAVALRAQPAPPSEELVRLRSLLESKERAVADVEEFRRRRLADLQAQYDARRTVYSEKHPEIVTLRQDIAALSLDSPQVTALREEEQKARRAYQDRLAVEQGPSPATAPVAVAAVRASVEDLNSAVEQSELVREARYRYQRTLESLNAAQLEQDTARSSFKHRYKVIWPPQLPKEPVSPKPWKIFGVGGLAALFFALLVSAAVDYRSGRIYERWQVDRELGLPIIAESSEP